MKIYDAFFPLMDKSEYKLVEKYLNEDDILLEWGSGGGTLYFAGKVKKVITIEHDIDWYNVVNNAIIGYDIKNIELYFVPSHSPQPTPSRYEQFKRYIEYPKDNNFEFTKVLIDGRARKYCAKSIYDIIDENVIVMIHDFKRPDYQKVLKYYDIIEQDIEGKQGLVVLKKKLNIIEDNDYY